MSNMKQCQQDTISVYDADVSRPDDIRAIQAALSTVTRVQYNRRARRLIEDRSGVPLAPTTVATLSAIGALGPVRHGAVAQRVGTQPSRISKEVRALVQAGLVTEVADPQDRRAVLLGVTDKGTDAVERYAEAARETLSEVLAELSDDEVTTLAPLLTRLATCFARAVPIADPPIESKDP